MLVLFVIDNRRSFGICIDWHKFQSSNGGYQHRLIGITALLLKLTIPFLNGWVCEAPNNLVAFIKPIQTLHGQDRLSPFVPIQTRAFKLKEVSIQNAASRLVDFPTQRFEIFRLAGVRPTN